MCDTAALRPCSVLPTFHARIGFFFCSARADFEQPVRVLEAFDIADDEFGLRIVDEIVHEIERTHADLVAGRDHLAEVESAVLGGEIHHGEAETAALGYHADPAGIVVGAEHRAEAGEHAVGDVDHALAVGTDHTDVVFASDSRKLLLHIHALAADL